MKILLLLLALVLVNLTTIGQLGTYTPTVTYTTTDSNPSIGDTVSYCVSVSDFTKCNDNWFNAFEIILLGADIISYDSSPNNKWKDDNTILDEPSGWTGWVYDKNGNDNLAFSEPTDYGDKNNKINGTHVPWEFCFTVVITSPIVSIDVAIWSDYDTGSYNTPCIGSIQGVPDGSYNLYNSNVLPVELSYFDGYNNGSYNLIKWVTKSEINNDYFTLERSYDGVNYTIIHKEMGNGNSSSEMNYSFNDYTYTLNSVNYYRLTQTDFNGKSKIFNVVSINNVTTLKKVIKVVNFLGQEVDKNQIGLVIEIYSDNTTKKIFNR